MESLVRIIALKTIREFWEDPVYRDSEQPLKSWYAITRSADWARPQDIKDQFANASIIGGKRVVFNIAANKYRLVVRFNYPYRIGYIRFIGTHAQYDAVDVERI
jgi:mRNA interferase HigB